MAEYLDVRDDAAVIAGSVPDPGLFGLIFDRYFDEVYRYLARRVSAADAADLASETFAIAFTRRNSYQPTHPSCRPWLFGIAHNLLRGQARTERRMLIAYSKTGLDPLADLESQRHLDDTAQRIDAEQQGPVLAALLAALNKDERDVLLLVAWAQLSTEEIATALRIPAGTVRSRLHRARSHLRAGITEIIISPESEGTPR